MTFTLLFSDSGASADSEIFESLDRARDVAFDISLETSAEVSIYSGTLLWETVMA